LPPCEEQFPVSALDLPKEFIMAKPGLSLLIAAIVVVLIGILFYTVDFGLKTAPVERAPQQNQGANAPAEQVPSPGTKQDLNGNTKLPAGQQ
jgi:hypothetical protein